MAFRTNIVRASLDNSSFRKVLSTSKNAQLVVMSIDPGDDIGTETHRVDQILVFVEGHGEYEVGDEKGSMGPGDVVFVPAGTQHEFVNTGKTPLRLYTIYAPPQHAPRTVHRTHADARAAEAAATPHR